MDCEQIAGEVLALECSERVGMLSLQEVSTP